MPVRTIEYEVHADAIYPNGMQFGGMQYEDNATEIKYTLSESLKEALGEMAVFRIDFSSASAGYHPSENLELESNTVSRTIPLEMTAFGGQMQTVFTALTVENGVETTVLSYPTTVYFTPVQKSDINSDRLKDNLSRFEIAMDEYLSDAKEICDTAKQLADEASNRVLQTPDALSLLDTKSNKQDVANALKGTTFGNTVTIDDLSPIDHTLKVGVSSKNLVKDSKLSLRANGGSMLLFNEKGIYDEATHTITFDSDITAQYGGIFGLPFTPESDKTYTLSFAVRGTVGKKVTCGWLNQKTTITLTENFVGYSTTISGSSIGTGICFYSHSTANGGLATGEWMQFSDVQIEIGTKATEYSEWVDVSNESLAVLNSSDEHEVDYPINADGTVDGVESIYPKMTLTATNSNLCVLAEYNRDINKAFEELLSKVGG